MKRLAFSQRGGRARGVPLACWLLSPLIPISNIKKHPGDERAPRVYRAPRGGSLSREHENPCNEGCVLRADLGNSRAGLPGKLARHSN